MTPKEEATRFTYPTAALECGPQALLTPLPRTMEYFCSAAGKIELLCASVSGKLRNVPQLLVLGIQEELATEAGKLLLENLCRQCAGYIEPVAWCITGEPTLTNSSLFAPPPPWERPSLTEPTYISFFMTPLSQRKQGDYLAHNVARFLLNMNREVWGIRSTFYFLYVDSRGLDLERVYATDGGDASFWAEDLVNYIGANTDIVGQNIAVEPKTNCHMLVPATSEAMFVLLAWDADLAGRCCDRASQLLSRADVPIDHTFGLTVPPTNQQPSKKP